MGKKPLIILLLIGALLLSGCYDKFEMGETMVVVAHGLDTDGNSKLISAQLALTPPREGQLEPGPKFIVVSSSALSFAEAGRILSLSLPRRPLWSMADTIIIGEKLAELDSGLFTDLLLRNPRLRYNVQLFVAKGVFPSEILEAEVFPEDYSGTALENIIDNQRGQAGIYIPVDIKDFLFKTGTAGIEPVLPQIIMEKSENQAKLKLQGTAVFKGRQMVGSLDEQQTRGLALLNPKSIHRTVFNIKSPGHGEETSELKLYDTMAMELTSYQIQVKPLINGNNITMNIIMEAKGNIIEDNNNHNISDPEMVSSIEREAARVLRQYIHSCIEQAQSLNSDILGWGLAISRSHPKTWMEIEASWPDMFAGISSNIQVKYELQQSYLLNDAFPFK